MEFSGSDMDNLIDILREAARIEVLPRFFSGSAIVREKTSQLDLVTDADTAAEAFITAALGRAFPNILVVGEEACAADPMLVRHLASADFAIVVDPIDGTKNFASGLPLFGIMAAVLRAGKIVAGVILDPIKDEWSTAIAGEGAWSERPGQSARRLVVCEQAPVEHMVGLISSKFLAEPLRSRVLRGQAETGGGVSYRSAAHEYRLIADGHYHFALFGKLMPWDHAAGWLLHREAGGYSALFDGRPYSVGPLEGGLLCAPNEAAWHNLHQLLLAEEST